MLFDVVTRGTFNHCIHMNVYSTKHILPGELVICWDDDFIIKFGMIISTTETDIMILWDRNTFI